MDPPRPKIRTPLISTTVPSAHGHDLAVRAQAAFRRLSRVTVIMVAVHINDGRIGKTGQEGQIFRGEIPCRENQIHTLKRLPAEISPEPGRGFIR